jgi:hypothetical protein
VAPIGASAAVVVERDDSHDRDVYHDDRPPVADPQMPLTRLEGHSYSREARAPVRRPYSGRLG